MTATVLKFPTERASEVRARPREVKAPVTTLATWAGSRDTAKKREASKERKSKGPAKSTLDRAFVKLHDMIASRDYEGAKPIHFLALYYWMHEQVYGVVCAEMGAHDRKMGCFAASLIFRKQFDSDPEAMIDFMRWVWNREIGREKWRRENRPDGGGGRIGIGLQFSNKLVTDYRLDVLRKKG